MQHLQSKHETYVRMLQFAILWNRVSVANKTQMLTYIKKRLAVGFAFVSVLISTFFAIWSFINAPWGPSTGSIVFNTIILGAVVYLGKRAFTRQEHSPVEPSAEIIDLDEV